MVDLIKLEVIVLTINSLLEVNGFCPVVFEQENQDLPSSKWQWIFYEYLDAGHDSFEDALASFVVSLVKDAKVPKEIRLLNRQIRSLKDELLKKRGRVKLPRD